MNKHWSDYLLFYVGEAMILLAGEWYIISDHYERHGAVSLPFCVGMLLTGLVAGVAMHWALIKLANQLIVGGYAVWFATTGLILFSAGVIWTANSHREEHEKNIAEAKAKAIEDSKLRVDEDTAKAKANVTANIATLQALQPLLAQAKTQAEKKRILETAQQMTAQSAPTPVPLEQQVAAALTVTSTSDSAPLPEWRAFEKDGFFDFWHSSVIRFTGLVGLIGMAILFGLHLKYDDADRALKIAQMGVVTTHTVTTPAAHHEPTRVAGYGQPLTAQRNNQPPTGNFYDPNSSPRQ